MKAARNMITVIVDKNVKSIEMPLIAVISSKLTVIIFQKSKLLNLKVFISV